jgi:hypothetical protein
MVHIPSSSEPNCCSNSWLAAEGKRSLPRLEPRALKRFIQRSRQLTGLDASNLREAMIRPYPRPERQSGWFENSVDNHCEALHVVPGYDWRGPRRGLGQQNPFPSGRGATSTKPPFSLLVCGSTPRMKSTPIWRSQSDKRSAALTARANYFVPESTSSSNCVARMQERKIEPGSMPDRPSRLNGYSNTWSQPIS